MTRPIWTLERDVLAIHDRLSALDGGAGGVRDAGLLASALARPARRHAYGEGPDVIRLAALYTDAILRDHPFVDGNERLLRDHVQALGGDGRQRRRQVRGRRPVARRPPRPGDRP